MDRPSVIVAKASGWVFRKRTVLSRTALIRREFSGDKGQALRVFLAGTAAGLAAVVCLAVAGQLPLRPEQLSDDAPGYYRIGRNWITNGVYSKAPEPPFVPDVTRPPLYPLFLYGVASTVGFWGVYVLQALMHGLTSGMVFLAARNLGAGRFAAWAGLAYAFDLAATLHVGTCLTETAYIALTIPGVILAARAFEERRLSSAILAGALLGASALVRPLSDKLVLVVALGAVLLCKRLPFGERLRTSTVLGATVLALVLPWALRNYRLIGRPTLSPITDVNLVYYVGTLPYEVRDGMEHKPARVLLEKHYRIPSYRHLMNPFLSDRPQWEMYRRIHDVRLRVLFESPAWMSAGLAKAFLVHMVKHSGKVLSALLYGRPKRIVACLRGLTSRGEALRVRAKAAAVLGAVSWQCLVWLAALGLALSGARIAVREFRPLGIVTVVAWAFLLISVLGFGTQAGVRARLPAEPLTYALAGSGAAYTWGRRLGTSTRTSPSG